VAKHSCFCWHAYWLKEVKKVKDWLYKFDTQFAVKKLLLPLTMDASCKSASVHLMLDRNWNA